MMHRVTLYSRFERFWHWTQMALILILLFSGFAIHGLHPLLDFGDAVQLHTYAALALVVLWLFAIFWHLTTGTWRHYVPTRRGLWQVARFYAYGIFKGEQHPYRKAYWRKHNPLQALAYLSLKLFLFPAVWFSGIAYLLHGFWGHLPGAITWFEAVAVIHVAAAFAILVFLIVHVYMLTLGHSFKKHLMPMITGEDEVELTAAQEAYLRETGVLKDRKDG
jgi:thiosulfate reductase cytochrome b subunit